MLYMRLRSLASYSKKFCSSVMYSMKSDKRTNQDFFVWTDLEMTGLDVSKHKIVEVCCVLTDTKLNKIHEGLHMVIHHPKDVFDNECSEWSQKQHTRSGLIGLSLKSDISISDADERLSNYIKSHTNYECNNGFYIIAGNSVYMDKIFIEKYMPLTHQILHYQILDVSSIYLLCRHWYPEKCTFEKKKAHRALDDIIESMSQLQYLKDNFFIKNS